MNGYSIDCFLIGGIFALITAIWDVASDGSMLRDADAPLSFGAVLAYKAILIFSPFFYLMDAVFDISMAERIRADSVLFGIGAICELLAAVLADTGLGYDRTSRIITLISTHAYILNVIVLLIDHRQHDLIFCGNVIFAIGASIDLILSYGSNWNPIWLEYGNLVSAVCWFLDALVYIAADRLHGSLETPLLPLTSDATKPSKDSIESPGRDVGGPKQHAVGGLPRIQQPDSQTT